MPPLRIPRVHGDCSDGCLGPPTLYIVYDAVNNCIITQITAARVV